MRNESARSAVSLTGSAFPENAPQLHRYLLRRVRHSRDAEDLGQEVFARTLRVRDAGLVRAAAAAPEAPGPGITQTLTAHEEAHVSRAGSVKVRLMPEVTDAVAWQQRRLVLRQQPLRVIVEEFNRYSRKKIRLEGPAVVDHSYSGAFDADDADSLVQVLGREADLAVDASADNYGIRSR